MMMGGKETNVEQVTYDYPFAAQLRKPLVFLSGFFTVFIFTWLVSKIDLNIAK
jgi:oligosaccharyltransferase complex subunit alpha (ribophorin I)